MRTALYVRVSTIEASKNGYSIGEQEERLRNYCKAKNWDVYHVYVDGGYSGKSTDRPALQDLLKDLEQERFDAVLVYKLDRLSRSQKDTMELIEDVFLPNKIDFISMTENLDTTSPVGMAMIGLLSVFAQLERAQIAERMAIGKEGRAKEGKYHGNKFSPIGYEYKNDKLHVIPYEAMMVQKFFERFAQRIPANRICKEMKEAGYRHRYGYFIHGSVRRMLRNKLYIGYIENNGNVYKGLHEPIISEELFYQVQKILDEQEKSNPNRKYMFKANSALAGIVSCKHCGSKYCRVMGQKKLDGTKTKFYSCYSRNKKSANKIKDPNCKNKIWRMDELENRVFAEITKLSFDPQYIENIKNERDNDDDRQEQVELINNRIEEINGQISRLTQLFKINSLDIDEIKREIDPLALERQSLRNELEYMNKEHEESTEQIYEIAKGFGEVLERGNLEEIQFVVNELIDNIVVDNENITIHWKFA